MLLLLLFPNKEQFVMLLHLPTVIRYLIMFT